MNWTMSCEFSINTPRFTNYWVKGKANVIPIFLLILLCCSCASIPSASIPEISGHVGDQGLVFGSFSIENEKPIFNRYVLYFESDSTEAQKGKNRITVRPEQIYKMKLKPDFFDGTKAVHFFGFKKPPGNYRFTKMLILRNNGMRVSSAEIPFDLSFEVTSGEINYLGEVHFIHHLGRLQLSDQSGRDLPILADSFRSINWEMLKKK